VLVWEQFVQASMAKPLTRPSRWTSTQRFALHSANVKLGGEYSNKEESDIPFANAPPFNTMALKMVVINKYLKHCMLVHRNKYCGMYTNNL
jgi:hypothetical protein